MLPLPFTQHKARKMVWENFPVAYHTIISVSFFLEVFQIHCVLFHPQSWNCSFPPKYRLYCDINTSSAFHTFSMIHPLFWGRVWYFFFY